MSVIEMVFRLLAAHAVSDFALQPEAMAKGKNRHNVVDPPKGQMYVPCWMYWLTAHALVSGCAVYVATGIWWLGACETVAHWLIDFGKCEGMYGPHGDQWAHLVFRAYWLWWWWWRVTV
jgi:hypothetical protein